MRKYVELSATVDLDTVSSLGLYAELTSGEDGHQRQTITLEVRCNGECLTTHSIERHNLEDLRETIGELLEEIPVPNPIVRF